MEAFTCYRATDYHWIVNGCLLSIIASSMLDSKHLSIIRQHDDYLICPGIHEQVFERAKKMFERMFGVRLEMEVNL